MLARLKREDRADIIPDSRLRTGSGIYQPRSRIGTQIFTGTKIFTSGLPSISIGGKGAHIEIFGKATDLLNYPVTQTAKGLIAIINKLKKIQVFNKSETNKTVAEIETKRKVLKKKIIDPKITTNEIINTENELNDYWLLQKQLLDITNKENNKIEELKTELINQPILTTVNNVIPIIKPPKQQLIIKEIPWKTFFPWLLIFGTLVAGEL